MLIKSGIITQASGSIGGLTASHNRGGMYFRARTIPVNPSSAAQQITRNLMSQLATAWVETLSAVQRTNWETYAANVLVPNALGDPRQLTGLNHYVRSNVPRLQAGLTRVDDAPTIFDLGTFTPPTIAVASSSDTVAITFEATDAWVSETGSSMTVLGSRNQNLSVNFFKGPYQFVDSIDGDATTPPSPPATLTSPFDLTAGTRSFYSVRVTRSDGRLSTPFRTVSLNS